MDSGSCGVCQVKAARKCTRCWEVVYCSEEHQRQDWGEHKKGCSPPMILKTDPELGQYWVASRDLRAGTLLVKELPALKFSSWPDFLREWYVWTDDATCLGCGFRIKDPCLNYRCSKCKWPVCNAECEKARIHAENECGVFVEKRFRFPPAESALISPRRIDWAVAIIRASRLKASNRRLYREILNLQSKPSIYMPRIFEDVLREGMELLNLHFNIASLGMGKDEVVRLFWSMKLNSFNCVEMENGGGEGLSARTDCIYPKWSKFNNSCAPNCAYSIKPKAPEYPMMVRTTVAVKEGEELGIPYTEHICMPFEERQEGFVDRFHFVCKCKRCLDPTDLGTYSSAVTCEPCYEDRKKGIEMGLNEGYLLPEDPHKSLEVGESAIWKCNRCKKQTAAGTFLPTLKKLARFVKKPIKSFEVVEKLKTQYSEKVLHPSHWILQKASQAILELWDTRGAKGTDQCPFEAYKTHFMHRMELENVLNPGISQYRAHMQRDFVVAAVTARQLEKGKTTSEEKLELLKTCYRFIREANMFFDYFKDGVPQGALNYHITANVRRAIEALMKACGQELEEDL